jgi:hypothetical protein
VQPERNPVKDFGKRKATGLKTQIPKAEISARSNNNLESRRCSRAAAPKKGSEEQVLEANLTTEEAFNKQEIKKNREMIHAGWLFFVPLHQPDPPVNTYHSVRQSDPQQRQITKHTKRWISEASRCKTWIKKKASIINGAIITARKREPKIQSWSGGGGAKAYQVEPLSGGAAEVSGSGGEMPRSTELPTFSLHLSQPIAVLVAARSLYPSGRLLAWAGYTVGGRQYAGPTGRIQSQSGGRNRLLVTSLLSWCFGRHKWHHGVNLGGGNLASIYFFSKQMAIIGTGISNFA